MRHILWLPHALHRDILYDLDRFWVIGWVTRSKEFCSNWAGPNRIHSNPKFRHLQGPGFGHPNKTCFTSCIDRPLLLTQCSSARNTHNTTKFSLAHMR